MNLLDDKSRAIAIISILVQKLGGEATITELDFNGIMSTNLVESVDGETVVYRLVHDTPNGTMQ